MLTGCPSRPAKSYDFHGSLTLGTLKDRPGSWYTYFDQDMQNHLDQRQQLFGVAMQKTIISDPAKTFWQNMLQNEPQEDLAFDRAIEGFAGTAFHIHKSDIAILIGYDIIFGDDAPV